MIGFFRESDRKSIVNLWRRTFNDSEAYINDFINVFSENIIVYRTNDVVTGMVSLLDVYICEHKGGYIYALAVAEDYRNQKIATRLLAFAEETMLSREYRFSIVVPEPYKCLESFYKKLGFNRELPLYTTIIQSQSLASESNTILVDKDEYFHVRTVQPNLITHSKKFFDYVYKDLNLDGFQFLKVQSDTFKGYCVCVVRDDCAIIKEAIPIEHSGEVAHCVYKVFNLKKAILVSNKGEQKCTFALLKHFDSEFDNDVYANLLLDSFGG